MYWLANEVLEAIAPHVGITYEELNEIADGDSILRAIHYPPTGDSPIGMRSAPHEDINFLTLLPAASATGLQVYSEKFGWIDAPTDPDLIIVNVGDMFQEFSGKVLKSTTHRVTNTEAGQTQSRFSLPFFFHPNSEFYLSYKYPTAGAYLEERLKEIGLKK